MKKIFFMACAMAVLMVGHSAAQMGHGVMRDGHMMGQGGMMGQEGMTGREHMAEHAGMMDSMRVMADDISAVMHQMSDVMRDIPGRSDDTSRERMRRISGMMRDMSAEMNKMSWMLDKGTATDAEIGAMRERMTQIRRQMSELVRRN